ncbi:hypothetical protein SJDPG4_09875 [Porphyromonas gingivalis SJD4]|nr:hypothetical protein SJDPG4_09875 [Porphyromonas gingivalis SJD4]
MMAKLIGLMTIGILIDWKTRAIFNFQKES